MYSSKHLLSFTPKMIFSFPFCRVGNQKPRGDPDPFLHHRSQPTTDLCLLELSNISRRCLLSLLIHEINIIECPWVPDVTCARGH